MIEILLAVSVVLNVVFCLAIYKLVTRVFEFDELFESLVEDIDVNVTFFNKLLMTPLFDNSQEVKTANHNMMIISKRLTEFSLRIKEKTNKEVDVPETVE